MPITTAKFNAAAEQVESAGFRLQAETPDAEPVTLHLDENTPVHNIAEKLRQLDPVISLLLQSSGAVLLRGAPITTAQEFRHIATSMLGELAPYRERSSPRHELDHGVYTSTDYPAAEQIFLHNENSYQLSWPRRLLFCCLVEPESGGETPTADLRLVRQAIPDEIVHEFQRRGWKLVRNYREGLGLSWQEVFGTSDRIAVEDYCAGHGLFPEWLPDGSLRTRTTTRQALHRHPDLGIEVWFNHVTFWHVNTLPPATREALTSLFSPEELPASTYYGDGSTIPDDVAEALRKAYLSAQRQFRWRRGDVLIVDNMLAAHGRNPFTGDRKIAVAMS